jgi:Tfp pilus assembly protein PilO
MVKNIIIIVLVIIIVVLGYMLMVSFPEKAETECTAKCTETVQAQVTSAVQECMTNVQECLASAEECQQMLDQLIQVPACAEALSQ